MGYPTAQLHLQDDTNTPARIYRTDVSIPSVYIVEYKAKLDDFAPGSPGDANDCNTLGTKVCDGSYRLMLSIEDDGIWAITSAGSWSRVKTLAMDKDWHEYRVAVNNGTANVYMDDNWQCSFSMQTRSDPDQFEHWCEGLSINTAESYVEYSKLYYPD